MWLVEESNLTYILIVTESIYRSMLRHLRLIAHIYVPKPPCANLYHMRFTELLCEGTILAVLIYAFQIIGVN